MKRIICLLLVTVMLLPTVACAGGGDGTDGSSNGPVTLYQGDKPEYDEYGRPWVDSAIDVNSIDLNERTVTVLYRDRDTFKYDWYSEGIEGDVHSRAIYDRNVMTQEHLNYKLAYLPHQMESETNADASIALTMEKSRQSGMHEYDIAMIYGTWCMPYALRGWYMNLRESENLHFDKPWYNQEYVEQNTMYNALFGLVNDINICGSMQISALFFNVDKATDHGITEQELYDHVNNGTWTLETFAGYVKDLYVDAPGADNGKRDIGDQYGLVFGENCLTVDGWTAAMNITNISFDNEGNPYLSFYSPRTEDILEKLYNLYWESEGVFFEKLPTGYEGDLKYWESFKSGNSVFMLGLLADTQNFRDMNDTYGLLPIPKYDESQTKHYTDISVMVNTMIIPSDIEDDQWNATTLVLEYTSELTYRYVRPAVFEKVIKHKYLDSPGSAAMFDILIDGIKADFGVTYTLTITTGQFSWSDMNYGSLLRNALLDDTGRKKTTFSSSYEKWESKYQKNLQNKVVSPFLKVIGASK